MAPRVKMLDGTHRELPLCHEVERALAEEHRYHPVTLNRTLTLPPCGCHIDGSGLIPDPVRIHQCPLHEAARDLLDALDALLQRFDPYAVPGTDETLEAERRARDVLARARGGA